MEAVRSTQLHLHISQCKDLQNASSEKNLLNIQKHLKPLQQHITTLYTVLQPYHQLTPFSVSTPCINALKQCI